jgi:hypothetical protein
MVEIEQSCEPRSAPDVAGGRVVVACRRRRADELAAEPLVVALFMIVRTELVEQMSKVPLSEDDEVVETLFPNHGLGDTTLRDRMTAFDAIVQGQIGPLVPG